MDEAAAREELQRYFAERCGAAVRVRAMEPLGGGAGDKGFGYGAPLRVTLESAPVDQVVVHAVQSCQQCQHDLAEQAAQIA